MYLIHSGDQFYIVGEQLNINYKCSVFLHYI